jgi:hypothetical protein
LNYVATKGKNTQKISHFPSLIRKQVHKVPSFDDPDTPTMKSTTLKQRHAEDQGHYQGSLQMSNNNHRDIFYQNSIQNHNNNNNNNHNHNHYHMQSQSPSSAESGYIRYDEHNPMSHYHQVDQQYARHHHHHDDA